MDDPSYPPLALGCMTTIITIYTCLTAEGQRSQMRQAFGQYGSKTAEKAKDKFAALELNLITVKGKTEPQIICALLGREDIASAA